ncbi:hypothetical protein [Neosynechococcus sphagnicola]|uniref:hypothetical protein n=1 Tax=Neosynechococcus sphagnicola TaxID=1501145 RepID=UPI000907C7AB|nr:hypothetical protein [Neosynechococcus sphagnicola]
MNFNVSLVEDKAKEIRRFIVNEIGHLGVGHIGGCLSIADVLAVLYHYEIRIDPTNPKNEGRDRFILPTR